MSEKHMANILEEMDSNNAWDTENKAHMALEMLGCEDFMNRKMGELSGGQRKRVALAAALIATVPALLTHWTSPHRSRRIRASTKRLRLSPSNGRSLPLSPPVSPSKFPALAEFLLSTRCWMQGQFGYSHSVGF